ncbi:DUF6763 family protein [Pseudomonadota bacterium]
MYTNNPEIGAWFQTQENGYLEVVAYDPDEKTVEVQFYDGTIEEYELETWNALHLRPAEPPEDWSGSLDVSGDDYGVDLDRPAGDTHTNPLDELDKGR